jgi:Spy/CpxP family protein refolding chaperone
MLRNIAIALTTVVIVAVAANLQAQGQGNGRGRGMRGGPGGGMGFMEGPGGGMGMLLMNEKIQKELELSAEQKEKLQALGKELQKEQAANREANQKLSREERQAKRKENAEKHLKKIEAILLPHQLERIKQIQLQSQLMFTPGTVLAGEEVAKELELTEDQKAKIKAINEETQKAMQNAFAPGQPPQPDAFEKMQKSRKETETKLLEVLSADQKAKLEKMKGEKFDFASMMPPRGQGGNRRGARDGGNQNGGVEKPAGEEKDSEPKPSAN